MAVIKRIIKILVAVTTIFCVLAVTVLPVLAVESDDSVVNFIDQDGAVSFTVSADDFDLSDYVIAYEDYLYFSSYATTFNAASGVLDFGSGIAWSSVFAELGKVCSSGGLYYLGYALAGGALVYGIQGIIDTLYNDVPEVFYDTVSLIYMNSDEATRTWLEEAFDLYYEGEPITVPASVSQNIADVFNGLNLRDENGNVIDTALSIPTDYISGVFADSYASSTTISGFENIMFFMDGRTAVGSTKTVANDYISLTGSHLEDGRELFTYRNLITGTTLSLDFGSVKTGIYAHSSMGVSNFYQVVFENGCQFTFPYFSWYPDSTNGKLTSAKSYTPSRISADYPITITNSGTILDGNTITSVTWDETSATWIYEGLNDFKTAFPLDPLGLVISNTGANTTAGTIGGTAVGNDEDIDIFVTPTPVVPSAKDNTIGIPITNTLLQDATAAFEQDVATDDTIDDLTLDDPDKLMDFVGGLANYFDGLFDWLPDDFRDRLDGVMRTLTGLIMAMVAVKIIDVIWG